MGDIPRGGTVILRHDPSVEGLPFLLQAAATHVDAGHPVVFVSTNRSPERLAALIEEIGGRPHDIQFLDAYSGLMGQALQRAGVADPTDLVAVARAIDALGQDVPDAILLVDSLSGLIDHASTESFLAAAAKLEAATRRFRFAALLFTEWPYGADVGRAVERFDATVRLRGVEERVVLNQSLAVERSPWTKTKAPATLYRISKPGGVFAYIPKIVVIGPPDAGKSTFVQAVTEGAISVDRMGTTVAMDRGTARIGNAQVEVFGTPGQARFDPLLPTLAGQASAAIVVVDATRPETLKRGQEMLRKIWKRGLHVAIALNKQDLPGAISPIEARPMLTAPDDVTIVPCIAKQPDSARAVLAELIRRVLRGGA